MTLSLRVVQVAVHANIELKEAKVQIEGQLAHMSYTVREREEQYAQEMKKLQVRSRTCVVCYQKSAANTKVNVSTYGHLKHFYTTVSVKKRSF